MNKRMRELLAQMRTRQKEAEQCQKDGNSKGFSEALSKIEELKALYESEAALYEAEKGVLPDDPKDEKNNVSGFGVLAKLISKKKLTDAEDALLIDGENGEGYLVPQDVDLRIREARKSYQALKELVTVYPTTALSGTAVYDSEDDEDLDSFNDNEEIPEATNPKFTQKTWKIGFFGKTIPISNILLGAEQAGLMAYINRWFVRKAVRTENKKIIEALQLNKTAVEIKGLAGLKEQINTGIDSDYLIDGVILTNHTGFNYLDSETDAVGRPILNRDPANPTRMMYNGLPIIKVPDGLLPNTGKKAPIFIGSLKAGIAFYDYASLQFAVSEHVFFKKNQTALRVIEGFAVLQEFPEAYIYGLLSADSGKTVLTKTETA